MLDVLLVNLDSFHSSTPYFLISFAQIQYFISSKRKKQNTIFHIIVILFFFLKERIAAGLSFFFSKKKLCKKWNLAWLKTLTHRKNAPTEASQSPGGEVLCKNIKYRCKARDLYITKQAVSQLFILLLFSCSIFTLLQGQLCTT